MTTLAIRRPTPAKAAALRSLGGLEARRYARHPLFLIGTALLALTFIDLNAERGVTWISDVTLAPAFLLGILGLFVGLGLTRSADRSREAVDAVPLDGALRTAAMCLACLVPGLVALGWVAATYVAIEVVPMPGSAAISSLDRAAILLTGVVYAVGGPLLGVMIGRWTRFPGAGLVAAIALVVWTLMAGMSEGMQATRLSSLVQLHAPFTTWSGGLIDERPWLVGGSPEWYLAYISLLCGLAATAAMLHGSYGIQRSRLLRWLALLAVLALIALGLAVVPDPTRVSL